MLESIQQQGDAKLGVRSQMPIRVLLELQREVEPGAQQLLQRRGSIAQPPLLSTCLSS